jgi:PIN domain nuclease of toxin-antitoxin system
MTTVLLDSHVVHWWSAEPERVSPTAAAVLEEADELAVAAISWFELAWLARHERIELTTPIGSWLEGLAAHLRTVPITPSVAEAAVSLPASFPGDPADRLIYATAVERGWPLVTKDRRLRSHRHPKPVTGRAGVSGSQKSERGRARAPSVRARACGIGLGAAVQLPAGVVHGDLHVLVHGSGADLRRAVGRDRGVGRRCRCAGRHTGL